MSTDMDNNDEPCCAMRKYVQIGIVALHGEPPVEMADFVSQWEPQMILRVAYCSWCGRRIPPQAPVYNTPPESEL